VRLPPDQRLIPCLRCRTHTLRLAAGSSALYCRDNWREWANDPWYRKYPRPEACDFMYVGIGRSWQQVDADLQIPEGWTFHISDFSVRMRYRGAD
jgi:hypothetical protein